jgi:hypothetical protein
MPSIDHPYTRHLAGWILVCASGGVLLGLTSVPGQPLAPWLPDVARLLCGYIAVDVVLCGLRWCRCW